MKKWMLFLITITLVACSNDDEEGVYTGIIEGTAVRVPALTGGKIERMQVAVGEEVETGAVVAQIDSTELGLQFQQAQAQLEELAAQRSIANTNLARSGDDVRYAQERYDRVKQLVEKNSAPQQNLDDVENRLTQAKNARTMASQQLASLHAKQSQLEAQLKLLRKKISDTVVISPVSGMVSSIYFETGEAAPPLSPVAEIVHLQNVEVKIYIAAKLLPVVIQGQKVSVNADGLLQPFEGKVSWISPKSEFSPKSILTPETRASLVYAVKIEIKNPDGVLKHGMPVEVVL